MSDQRTPRDVEPIPVQVATWSEVPDHEPVAAQVEGVDLVVIRRGRDHSVLYGPCLHRGALLADGTIDGDNLCARGGALTSPGPSLVHVVSDVDLV